MEQLMKSRKIGIFKGLSNYTYTKDRWIVGKDRYHYGWSPKGHLGYWARVPIGPKALSTWSS